jgi:hypothetical protein
MWRINGTCHDFGTDGMEFCDAVAEGKDLCRADVGEAQRVEEED